MAVLQTRMTLSVRLAHAFPGFRLNIAFDAPAGTVVLFGPSGAGKSSVVSAVAGLWRPDACRIVAGDTILADTATRTFVPPERRRVGLVFQDARLFPHLSVRVNLRYGLRRAPPGPIAFDDVVSLLGIGPLLARRPRALSGGERQRVAIGRALLSQPRLLLMDEPLASLDAPRRAEILDYLLRLRALRLPILHVTHDLAEASRLADTLVLLDAGRVLASGPPNQVTSSASLPLAARDDAAAVLDGVISGHDSARGLTAITACGRVFLVPLLAHPAAAPVRLRIPAREVVLSRSAPAAISVQNVLPGIVATVAEETVVEVRLDGGSLLARVTPDAVRRLALAPGTPVFALVKASAVAIGAIPS